jgi:hypothetical protein
MYSMKVFQDVGEYITYLNTGNGGSAFPTTAIIATGKDPGNGSWYVVVYVA